MGQDLEILNKRIACAHNHRLPISLSLLSSLLLMDDWTKNAENQSRWVANLPTQHI